MKNIFLLCLILVCLVLPKYIPTQSVTFDGDVIAGNSLPRYGVLCSDALVSGNPSPLIQSPLYTLPKGSTVRIRDQSKPTGEYVMIKPAEWILLTALCK